MLCIEEIINKMKIPDTQLVLFISGAFPGCERPGYQIYMCQLVSLQTLFVTLLTDRKSSWLCLTDYLGHIPAQE